MFAGQPRLFNPLNISEETIDDVVFAGSYYEDKPERARLMDDIFDRLIAEGVSLRIYDRQHFKNWGNYPERFQAYTLPPIDYKDTADIYKKMKWGLNFNIVTDSETMFARRVFELALSNVYIITNYSLGVCKIFDDNIFVFDREDGIPDFTKDYESERMNNLYNVLENHTYKNRWKQILDTIGFEYAEERQDIAVIYKLNDESEINTILSDFKSIDYPEKTLNIIADDSLKDLKEKYGEIDGIYPSFNKLKKGISAKYIILIDGDMDNDFIRKAILHYQYLDKDIAIAQGSNKFSLNDEIGIENKVIPLENMDLADSDVKIKVYYI